MAADLAEVGASSPGALLSLFIASGPALRQYAAGALIQRDDRMALEFSAPRDIVGRSSADNMATLNRLATGEGHDAPVLVRLARDSAQTSASRGGMLLQAEAYDAAFDELARACDRDPTNQPAIDGFLRAAAGAERLDDAMLQLQRLNKQDPANVAVAVAVSRLLASRGDFVAAAEPLRPAFQNPRPDLRAMDQLASVFADANDLPRLASIVEQLDRLDANSEPAVYYAAALRFMSGHNDEAIGVITRQKPTTGRVLNLLGAAYAATGRTNDARRAFEQSLAADSRDPTTYTNLGELELEHGDPLLASRYFVEALTLTPESSRAKTGLSQALGRRRR